LTKTLLLAIGGIVSLLALIILFFGNDPDIGRVPTGMDKTTTTTGVLPDEDNDVSIEYRATTSPANEEKHKKPTVIKERLKLEPFMEAKTVERSGTFEIALINAQKDATKATGAYTTLQGKVDGLPFSLKVPQHLIDEGAGVTELRIKNRKTGEVSSVAAVFIDDMKDPSIKQSIDVNSKDIQNLQQSASEAIAPLLPGEMRE